MNYQLIKKWCLRSIMFLAVLSLTVFLWVGYEVKHMWGGYTTKVDTKEFTYPQEKIVITNVVTLSSDGNKMLANQTVIIDQGKIVSIAPTVSEIDTFSDARVIDGKGKYLIPGLIDSHVHLWQSPNDLLLYIANGVTHIREMNGSEDHLLWKQEIKNGRIGPDMFVSSSRLASMDLFSGWFFQWAAKLTNVTDIRGAKDAVQSFSDEGFDAVKVIDSLTKENYLAVNEATRQLNIPMLGHIPHSVELSDFWNSNQKELAHIEEILKALNREFGGYNEQTANEFLEFVRNRSEGIADNLSKNKIAVVSTLWLMESLSRQKFELEKIFNEVQLSYVNPGIIEGTHFSSRAMGWLPNVHRYRLYPNLSPERLTGIKIYWQTYAKAQQLLLKAMLKKGVIVLAGTDANVPVVVPGFSIHDELKSLTESGMTAIQALHSATVVPASWMKLKKGKISPNYQADLLLLNENPLDDIENTKTIDAVIVNGRLINRKQLDEILDAVKNANNQSRSIDISHYVAEPNRP